MNIYNPKNSKQLLIYVNPGFTGVHGYYKNHATKFLNEINKAGVALLHLTNKDLDLDLAIKYKVSLAYSLRPHLTLSSEENTRSSISEEFYNKMVEVFQRSDVGAYEKIYLYMYSGHPIYAAALSKVFNELHVKAKAYINFLYNEKDLGKINESIELVKSFKEWGKILQENDKEEQVVLSVDCPQARELYSDLLGREIRLLPAGCALPRHLRDIVRDKIRYVLKFRSLNVLYMGYPHRKYGYKLVKSLYDDTKDLGLYYHIRHQDAHCARDHKETREEWIKQDYKIDHYTGFIDEDKYNNLIRNSEIVIIPYLKEEYPYQTSGVFIEALSMNNVIVATKGTWFGNVVEHLGVGEVFESNNVESLKIAMLKVIKDYKKYKKKAITHGSRYREYWSMKNLFSSFG